LSYVRKPILDLAQRVPHWRQKSVGVLEEVLAVRAQRVVRQRGERFAQLYLRECDLGLLFF
jgi:hypothetical protein